MSKESELSQQINEFGELLIQMKAMEVENSSGESQGLAPAYGASDFLALQSELGFHHNARVERMIRSENS